MGVYKPPLVVECFAMFSTCMNYYDKNTTVLYFLALWNTNCNTKHRTGHRKQVGSLNTVCEKRVITVQWVSKISEY